MRFIELGDHGADGSTGRGSPGSGRWLGNLLQPLIDRRFARSECQRALRLYAEVSEERTDLHGRALYQEIVRRHLGGHPEQATAIVRRAEDSFATWPAARDVRFRDVVAYIVINELILHGHHHGTTTGVQEVVSKVIPAKL